MKRNYEEARKKAGLRREEACAKMHISLGTLINWETGRTNPNANDLRTMAQTYNVSADYLIGLA